MEKWSGNLMVVKMIGFREKANINLFFLINVKIYLLNLHGFAILLE